jgi:type IV secretion system protein VirB2
MNILHTPTVRRSIARWQSLRRLRPALSLFALLIFFPALAVAQSPFDSGFTAMQTLFTGTVAKVASLIAIVVGGYQFAHGEPGAKKVARRPTGTGAFGLLQRGIQQRGSNTHAHSFARAQSAILD